MSYKLLNMVQLLAHPLYAVTAMKQTDCETVICLVQHIALQLSMFYIIVKLSINAYFKLAVNVFIKSAVSVSALTQLHEWS